MTTVAVAELLLVLGFVTGYQKRFTYGAMLAACIALYLVRDLDTKWVVGGTHP